MHPPPAGKPSVQPPRIRRGGHQQAPRPQTSIQPRQARPRVPQVLQHFQTGHQVEGIGRRRIRLQRAAKHLGRRRMLPGATGRTPIRLNTCHPPPAAGRHRQQLAHAAAHVQQPADAASPLHPSQKTPGLRLLHLPILRRIGFFAPDRSLIFGGGAGRQLFVARLRPGAPQAATHAPLQPRQLHAIYRPQGPPSANHAYKRVCYHAGSLP